MHAFHAAHDGIASRIKAFYRAHAGQMSVTKQFHYWSRLFLLLNDAEAEQQLVRLRDAWSVDRERLRETLRQQLRGPAGAPMKGKAYRRPYAARHPKVEIYNTFFFRALFLQTVYHEDITDLLAAVAVDDVRDTAEQLLADPEALFALSTKAVNFLYHLDHFFPAVYSAQPQALAAVAERYHADFPWSSHARIYLYTHAIIGASRFYATPLVETAPYVAMLNDLERVIADQYHDTSLDQKCEMLVCARLLGTTSTLADRIHTEAVASFSPVGDFLIDTHNSYRRTQNEGGGSYEQGEHRNVLAIVAFSP